MAMRSGLFNSEKIVETVDGFPKGDRAELADFFAKYFAAFIGNGVYPNPSDNFQVMAYDQLTLRVRPGMCFINGYFGWDEEPAEITILSDTARHTYRAVLRLNLKTRYITIEVLRDQTELTRNETIWELALADIRVPANGIIISQNDITDLRLNGALCGLVHGVVEQLDTTTLGNELNGWIRKYKETTQADYVAFLDFLDSLKASSQSTYNSLIAHFQTLHKGGEEAYGAFLNYLAGLKAGGNSALERLIEYFAGLREQADISALQYTGYLQQLKSQGEAQLSELIQFFAGLKAAGNGSYLEFLAWLSAYEGAAREEFESWFEGVRGILGEDSAGNLLLLIQELQRKQPTRKAAEIPNPAGIYPMGQLWGMEYAFGLGGFGNGGFGGSPQETVPYKLVRNGGQPIEVWAADYPENGEVIRERSGRYHILFPDALAGYEPRSLILEIINDKEEPENGNHTNSQGDA